MHYIPRLRVIPKTYHLYIETHWKNILFHLSFHKLAHLFIFLPTYIHKIISLSLYLSPSFHILPILLFLCVYLANFNTKQNLSLSLITFLSLLCIYGKQDTTLKACYNPLPLPSPEVMLFVFILQTLVIENGALIPLLLLLLVFFFPSRVCVFGFMF